MSHYGSRPLCDGRVPSTTFIWGFLAGLGLAALTIFVLSPAVTSAERHLLAAAGAARPAIAAHGVRPLVDPPRRRAALHRYALREPAELEMAQEAPGAADQMHAGHDAALAIGAAALAALAMAAVAVKHRPMPLAEGPWRMTATFKGFGKGRSEKVKEPKLPKAEQLCACGSGQPYIQCCQPFHNKKKYPQTAEDLLRARYSAYANSKRDFIRDTTDPEYFTLEKVTLNNFIDSVALSCKNLIYEQMVILKEEPAELENECWLTLRYWFRFTAEFSGTNKGVTRKSTEQSDLMTITERSLFRKVNGKWLFVHSPDETRSQESFALGDTSEVQTDLLMKAKDAASAVGQKAADLLLPKKDIRLQME